MSKINNLIFRSSLKEPNTFIGGVSSVITNETQLAAKLSIGATAIKNFTIVGSDIECYIGVDYFINDFAFNNDTNITHYRDLGGNVKGLNKSEFSSVPNCTELYFPEVTYINPTPGNWAFQNGNLDSMYFPKCLSWGLNAGLEFNMFRSGAFQFNCTEISVHPSMATINGGGLEGDLAGMQSRGSTIIYV